MYHWIDLWTCIRLDTSGQSAGVSYSKCSKIKLVVGYSSWPYFGPNFVNENLNAESYLQVQEAIKPNIIRLLKNVNNMSDALVVFQYDGILEYHNWKVLQFLIIYAIQPQRSNELRQKIAQECRQDNREMLQIEEAHLKFVCAL